MAPNGTSSKYSPQNLTDVSGLVAVVTGGGTGLGLTIAKTLESNKAKVYITGRRQEKLDEAVKQAEHNNLIPIQGSTNSPQDIQRAIDQITAETGYIDILINNAGLTSFDTSPTARPKPTSESSISEIRDYYFNHRPHSLWLDVLDTNLASTFTTTIAFLELLDAGNKRRSPSLPTSQVLTISSVGGLCRMSDSFIYNASKAGVTHLMKNLGRFLAPHDIRTNVIAPGWFPSDMTVSMQAKWEHTGGEMPRTLVPTRRMGKEEELSATVLYLCGKGGGYCNGNVCVIDGGVLAVHPGSY